MGAPVIRYYAGFDEWSRLETSSGRFEWLRALEIVEREVPPGAAVLDIGGGPGRYALELARRGHRVVLADPSAAQLAVAREQATLQGLAFPIVEADARNLVGHADGGRCRIRACRPASRAPCWRCASRSRGPAWRGRSPARP